MARTNIVEPLVGQKVLKNWFELAHRKRENCDKLIVVQSPKVQANGSLKYAAPGECVISIISNTYAKNLN